MSLILGLPQLCRFFDFFWMRLHSCIASLSGHNPVLLHLVLSYLHFCSCFLVLILLFCQGIFHPIFCSKRIWTLVYSPCLCPFLWWHSFVGNKSIDLAQRFWQNTTTQQHNNYRLYILIKGPMGREYLALILCFEVSTKQQAAKTTAVNKVCDLLDLAFLEIQFCLKLWTAQICLELPEQVTDFILSNINFWKKLKFEFDFTLYFLP